MMNSAQLKVYLAFVSIDTAHIGEPSDTLHGVLAPIFEIEAHATWRWFAPMRLSNSVASERAEGLLLLLNHAAMRLQRIGALPCECVPDQPT
jgi:hypothetical protein